MNKSEHGIAYTMRKSSRARYMRLAVYAGGELVVTAPSRIPLHTVEQFIVEKADWILRTTLRMSKFKKPVLGRGGRREYLAHKDTAFALAHSRLAHFNEVYEFAVGKISIRNQKTRWGSCSKKGNLNFNYKIALLPPHLCDYIIVHELCHLKEFNHGVKFWALVEKTLPNHTSLRRELKLC